MCRGQNQPWFPIGYPSLPSPVRASLPSPTAAPHLGADLWWLTRDQDLELLLDARSLWDLPPGTLDTLCLPGLMPPNPYRPLHGVPVVSAWSYSPSTPFPGLEEGHWPRCMEFTAGLMDQQGRAAGICLLCAAKQAQPLPSAALWLGSHKQVRNLGELARRPAGSEGPCQVSSPVLFAHPIRPGRSPPPCLGGSVLGRIKWGTPCTSMGNGTPGEQPLYGVPGEWACSEAGWVLWRLQEWHYTLFAFVDSRG